MNEAETRAELIDPALLAAGWGVVADSRTRREVIAPGRIMGGGRRANPKSADYVLVYRNTKLGVIEAKAVGKSYTEGVGQAKDYAACLDTRFAFATNGREIYRIDMATGAEGRVERYPTPDDPDPPTEKLIIRLADGKERALRHISGTTFWDASGKPISAQQFVEQLFGRLPELFGDEDELRRIWSDPDTRKALIEGLAERGFAGEQLKQIRRMIDAEASDLFDVLRYIAFTKAPLKRIERAEARRSDILSQRDAPQAEFLDFVLSQYVAEGETELGAEKLPDLLALKYGSPTDALQRLGRADDVRRAFRDLQQELYRRD